MCRDYKIVGEHLWGGLAEYVVVPARNIIPVPDHIPSEVAVAVPAVYTTAWRGVVTVGKVKPSDIVLVIGASGGLGSAQLDIAVAAGATVIGIAGSEEKRQKCLDMGAKAMFDSHGEWQDEVMKWTDGKGVDLVLDSVGKPTFRKSLNCLNFGGRLVLSGATAGDFPEISIREIYQWHRQVLGAPMGNWEDFLQVTECVWQEKLHPQVHAVYPLEEIATAEVELDKRKHFGKIVIKVS
jgi:NADPH:quinone reductase-like Zn-dependent oxidoreductase